MKPELCPASSVTAAVAVVRVCVLLHWTMLSALVAGTVSSRSVEAVLDHPSPSYSIHPEKTAQPRQWAEPWAVLLVGATTRRCPWSNAVSSGKAVAQAALGELAVVSGSLCRLPVVVALKPVVVSGVYDPRVGECGPLHRVGSCRIAELVDP